MIEVSDSTRSGWAMAMVWAIIPPIDDADHVGRVDAEVVEHADGVVGHVEQVVRRVDRASPPNAARIARIGVDVGVDLGGQPDVAVVEADDEEAPVDEALAEVVVPRAAAGAEAR